MTSHAEEIKRTVNSAVEQGDVARALDGHSDLWEKDPGLATAAYVVSSYDRIRDRINLPSSRIALMACDWLPP